MALFSFVREAGEKLPGFVSPENSEAEHQLRAHIEAVGLGQPNIAAHVEGDHVVLKGEVFSPEEREKVILCAGNIRGVAAVDDQITVLGPLTQPAGFITVKSGDTLASIAQAEYGDAGRHDRILEANKPMLAHPDKIYPGMALRLPN
ncbi:peptidoglycan-binding protein LysM [Streptomyces sp. NPDC054995]